MNSSDLDRERIRVLVVDDHPVIRLGARCALANKPRMSIVGEVGTISAAITAAAELRPNVVLMDINLPDGDGIDAVAQIRNLDDKVRVVMFTSNTSEEFVIRSLESGASGYCLKGEHPDLLYLAIMSAAAGAIWLAPQVAQKIAGDLFRTYTSPDQQSHSLPGEVASTFGTLSIREREVLELLAAGLSNQELAMRLNISVSTAKAHVRNILRRLGVSDRTQAAVKALRTQLVPK